MKLQQKLVVYSEDMKLPEYYQKQYETQQTRRNFRPYKAIVSMMFMVMIIFFLYLVIFNYLPLSSSPVNTLNFSGSFDSDYSFSGSEIHTTDGWTFTMTHVKEYELTARVLAMHTYEPNSSPYRPINAFSPMDLVLGVDDIISQPERFPYRITSFHDREVTWYFDGTEYADYNYFTTHTGNHHIIPHNEGVNIILQTLEEDDVIYFSGSLVDLYGTRENENYSWFTDTTIGNYHCEIVLIDSITILS